MIKQCISCEKQIEDVAFCPYCGAAQRCIQCNTEFTGEENFCGNCGAKRAGKAGQQVSSSLSKQSIENAQTKDAASNDGTKKLRKIPSFIWALGAAVIIVLIYFATSPFQNDEKVLQNKIEQYFEAAEHKDVAMLMKLTHPKTPNLDDADELYNMPYTIEFDFHDFYNWDITDNYAKVTVLVTVYADFEQDFYHETEQWEIELMRWKDEWRMYSID